jgi:hypothetical protein
MIIEIEGQKFSLDTTKAIASGSMKKLIEHKVGNFYLNTKTESLYVLASVDVNKYRLICVRSQGRGSIGNRYSDCGSINRNESCEAFTEDQWKQICGNRPDLFVLSE